MGETEKKQRKQASNCKLWRVLCAVKEREGVCSMFWMVRDGLSEEVTFHFHPEENWYDNELVIGREEMESSVAARFLA